MIAISNEDYQRAVRLLKTLVVLRPLSRRDEEAQRQARLLLKKWNRKNSKKQDERK